MKFKARSFISVFGVLLFVLIFISESLFAQVYPSRTRSPFLEWKTLRSDSFVIYYPQGARGTAIQTAFILDDQLPVLQERYGSELTRFPIILNPNNALSNGYVATFPYRSEIEILPLKGKVLNPASGGWLETVVPHELVHAVHYQMKPEGALTNVMGLFSPDLRRSIHGMVPVGLHEGIAVDHESHSVFSTPDLLYGRGSYPYFINRFEIALIEEPWSLGQLFQISGSTLPYDRHYLGGYAFMSWLRERVGEEVITSTIERHYKQPYLGYGWALKKETGLWPSSLYKEFSQQEKIRVNERLRSSSTVEKEIWEDRVNRLSFSGSFTGAQLNRPLWLSENQLVAHGRFYNAPSGYYRIDLPAQPSSFQEETQTALSRRSFETRWALDLDLLVETVSVSDYQSGFSADSSSILFSKLIPSIHFEQEWTSVLSSFTVEEESTKNRFFKRKKQGRAETLLKPQNQKLLSFLLPKNQSFVSLFGVTQNHSYTLALSDSLDIPVIVEISQKSSSERNHLFIGESYSDQGLQIDRIKNAHSEILPVQLQLKPGNSDTVAVIARVRGLQGLWITKKEEIYSHIQSNPPTVSFKNASVLDVSWHPFSPKVLFTSDRNQVIQIYELDLIKNHLHQLSFSEFNVFEPSYSPSGSQLAFVEQSNPEQQIGVVSVDSIKTIVVEKSEWNFSQNQASVYAFRPRIGLKEEPLIQDWKELFIASPTFNNVPEKWDEGDYRAGFKWLKPRLWTPVSNEITESERNLGLFFATTDPLREQTLSSEITLFKDQLWWETNYVYSGFWPGFQITSQKIPSFQTFRFSTGPVDNPETTTFTKRLLLRERGVDVSLPFQWNLSPGLYRRSTFSIQPSLESTQALFFNENGSSSLSDKVRLTRIGLFISYQHLLRQNSRSIFPDRGALLYFQTEKNSKTKTFELEVENRRYRTNFSKKAGIRLGGAVYFPIYSKYNQSGRFLMELISQTDIPVFSLESLTRNLITRNPLPGSNGGLFSEVRLVFPLKTVDDGGLTVPLYLNSIYLQTIHQTYLPYRNQLSNGFSTNHAVFGSGVALRTRFRISNVALDFGLGLFWDTQSKKGEVLIGVF